MMKSDIEQGAAFAAYQRGDKATFFARMQASREAEFAEKMEYQAAIEVGEYLNISGWSDTTPYKVIARTAKTITIAPVECERDPSWKPNFNIGGFAANCSNQEGQRWFYKDPGEDAPTCRANWTKKGWKSPYGIGRRADRPFKYYDYNF